MHPATARAPTRPARDWLAAAALAILTFAAFARVLGAGFVNYDDTFYVTGNPHVLGGLSLPDARWAFTTFYNSNWHPLTWLSLQLDATLWHASDGTPDPRGFHLTNVLVHSASAAALFLALRVLTGCFWCSAAVALLFAVHPLRAESVAWVSERKDVLSVFFGLLALWAYAGYARSPSVARYLLVAVPFALSLLAKPTLVTLPCLFLVLDWWPLARVRTARDWPHLAVEKLPLLAFATVSCILTIRAQTAEGAVMSLEKFPPAVRAGNAAVSYVAYLAKTAWPGDLAVYYPHPGAKLSDRNVARSVLILAALAAGAVVLRRRAPYLLAGWLWFLGTLVPAIGLVQAGDQAYADRYTYFPQIGLLVALCWGAADLAGGHGRVVLAAGAAAAAALAVVTWNQLAVWNDSVALWDNDLRQAGPSYVALMARGEALDKLGRLAESAASYEGAARLDRASARPPLELGMVLQKQGKLQEAAREFEEACRLAPASAAAHLRLGNVLYRQGKLDAAKRHYEDALPLAAEPAEVFSKLGTVEAARGNLGPAADCYNNALRLRPDLSEALGGLGAVRVLQGRPAEGVALLREAVARDPASAQAHNNLADALLRQSDLEGAAGHFAEAARLSPESAVYWFNLGMTRGRQGRMPEAAESLARAVELDPASDRFRDALAAAFKALAGAGRQDVVARIESRLRPLARDKPGPTHP